VPRAVVAKIILQKLVIRLLRMLKMGDPAIPGRLLFFMENALNCSFI
jgi:hypothetical protein